MTTSEIVLETTIDNNVNDNICNCECKDSAVSLPWIIIVCILIITNVIACSYIYILLLKGIPRIQGIKNDNSNIMSSSIQMSNNVNRVRSSSNKMGDLNDNIVIQNNDDIDDNIDELYEINHTDDIDINESPKGNQIVKYTNDIIENSKGSRERKFTVEGQ